MAIHLIDKPLLSMGRDTNDPDSSIPKNGNTGMGTTGVNTPRRKTADNSESYVGRFDDDTDSVYYPISAGDCFKDKIFSCTDVCCEDKLTMSHSDDSVTLFLVARQGVEDGTDCFSHTRRLPQLDLNCLRQILTGSHMCFSFRICLANLGHSTISLGGGNWHVANNIYTPLLAWPLTARSSSLVSSNLLLLPISYSACLKVLKLALLHLGVHPEVLLVLTVADVKWYVVHIMCHSLHTQFSSAEM